MSAADFPAFFFDGNRWFGAVESSAGWRELVAAYRWDAVQVLAARGGCGGEPPHARWEGGLARFDFRSGGETLAVWTAARGRDLLAKPGGTP